MAGTSADFYMQEADGSLIWIGSMEFDGYPYSPELKAVVEATTRADYQQGLVRVAENDDHYTRQEQGYPFGRKSSAETPFTYVFLNEGYVGVYKRGRPAKDGFPKLKFPDLTSIRQSHVEVKTKVAAADAIRAASASGEGEDDE